MNHIIKSTISEIITLVKSFFASSFFHSIDILIPETTSINTDTRIAINVMYFISQLSKSITLPNQGLIVHSYFLVSKGWLSAHEQVIHGIFSVTTTLVQPVVLSAAKTKLPCINKTKLTNNITNFFIVIFYNLKPDKSFRNA